MTTTAAHPSINNPFGLTPLEWDAIRGIVTTYDHFDDGHATEGSGIWSHVHDMLAALTGVSKQRAARTFRSLVNKGLFVSDIQDGDRWYSLTELGANISYRVNAIDTRDHEAVRAMADYAPDKPIAAGDTRPHSHSSHADHGHALTPSARAACRKARAAS